MQVLADFSCMCTEFQSLDSPSFELRYFGLDSFFGFLHIELCLNFAKFMELCQVLPKYGIM